MLAAAVGIIARSTEATAAAEDHVLTGGSSAQPATVPYGLLASMVLMRRGPGAAVGATAVLGRLVACEVDLPGQHTWLAAACKAVCDRSTAL